MAVFKCKMCGGTIEFRQGDTVGVCDSCGTKQTLPTANDEIITNLHNRANTLRLKCEFDKAEEVYNKILLNNPNDPEAHWGIILCKYGIEYVEDPKTYRRVPTCHRTSFDAILADEDYKQAMANGDGAQREIYEAEAKEIDRIQKDILAIVKNEKPFDVFICYKETDENGKRTQDSVIANEIYYQLTQEGFKVFYAVITLEDKLGMEYEPYIFAALNSSKVMLVVGTKPEYYNAVWVKNEWFRFLKLMKTDRQKLLIPCYKDIDAYELPEEFAHLQAQDMTKIGFINDLVRGIKKVIADAEPKTTAKETVVVSNGNSTVSPLLKRAFMFLEDGEWGKADEFCEQVLNLDPENHEAYLGKLMAELQVHTKDDLKNCKEPFDHSNQFQKALRFGNDEFRTEIQSYITYINERNETERLTNIYNDAVNKMNAANNERLYLQVSEVFQSIEGFKDSNELAEKCIEKAEVCRKDKIYSVAKQNMRFETVGYYEGAIKGFQSIPGWKDADEQVYTCQKRIEEIQAKREAARLEAERKDEEWRIAREKAAKRSKTVAAIVIPSVAACIAFLIVLTTVIIPDSEYNAAVALMNDGKYEEAIAAFEALNGYKDSKYNAAVALMNDGKYEEAITAFEALNGYKDSENQIESCYIGQYGEEKWNKIKNIKIGDTYTFGAYEQDNSTSNGKEAIEWTVLDKDGMSLLLVSKQALDCQKYNPTQTNVTWETCSLRKWMNGTFLNNAFSAGEQAQIQNTNVSADKNAMYSTNPGNATTDKVFLLSTAEVQKYFSSDSAKQCKPTKYAIANGAYVDSDNGNCWWWLRSPGTNHYYAAFVGSGGSVRYDGSSVDFYGLVWGNGNSVDKGTGCVRPALWINLDS